MSTDASGGARQTFHLGAVRVELYDGYTMTHFRDGTSVVARHDDCAHVGQTMTAYEMGYPTVEAMNRDHDLVHSLLALWMGLRSSPTLYGLAHNTPWPQSWCEEAVVVAIQRWLVVVGLDAVTVAARYQEG